MVVEQVIKWVVELTWGQVPMGMLIKLQKTGGLHHEPQKIDFDTLRARLPQEIGDDIVRLIAASPEALEDFATIATQQDVDLCSTKNTMLI